MIIFAFPSAGVLELVDNPDLGSGGASRGGSSPPTRTRETARPNGRVFASDGLTDYCPYFRRMEQIDI